MLHQKEAKREETGIPGLIFLVPKEKDPWQITFKNENTVCF